MGEMRQTINVNGTTYASWADVPAEVRATLAGVLPDSNGDGMPDLFETGALPTSSPPTGGHLRTTFTSTSVSFNGKTYAADDPDLPASARQLMERMAAGGSGTLATQPPTPLTQPPAGTAPSAAPIPVPPAPGADQVILNGVPVDLDHATTTPGRKHWWKRG